MAGQPGSLGSLVRPKTLEQSVFGLIADLQRQVNELKTARTLGAAALGDGSLQIAGGEILLLDTSGTTRARLGTDALGVTFSAFYDSNGILVASDDPVRGGLQRPWLSMPIYDNTVPASNTTTSGSFVTVQQGYAVRAHGGYRWDVLVSSSSVGTTGNARLVDGASNTVATVTIPANTTTLRTVTGTWPTGTWTANDAMYLTVQVQVTGGTGNVGAKTVGLWGEGSA